MQSENFDNKIKQAAEQHHPEYDGKAWHKMEKLLDRHLPQSNDRRKRGILFLLLVLVVGGGTWMLVSQPWKPADRTLTTKETTVSPDPSKLPRVIPFEPNEPSTSTGTKEKEAVIPTVSAKESSSNNDQPAVVIDNTVPVVSEVAEPGNNNLKKAVASTQRTAIKKNESEQARSDLNELLPSLKNKVVSKNNSSTKDNNDNDSKVAVPGIKDRSTDSKVTTVTTNNDKATVAGAPKSTGESANTKEATKKDVAKDEKADNSTVTDDKKDQPSVADNKKNEKKSIGNKKTNKFFFSLSAAPDLSWIGSNEAGKIKLLTGVGIGYTVKERLTIRTGFYSGRKVYSAKWGDYKPEVTPPNPQYISNIDADCKVYEIPVNLSYNFAYSKNHNLFAGAGLSTLIMKKEEYVYEYKWPNGTGYSYTKHIQDEYKHYFSVLTLSAGYQQKINRTISLSVEPYAKLPLKGVGYGKVKLASAGVMVSAIISPFQSSAKK